MTEPLTIISLDITNFARIKAVRIEPDPNSNTVTLTGKNGNGKSSVMDAIRVAIDAAGNKIDWPVRAGTDGAEIVAVFGTNGVPELIVERTITPDGKTSLVVKDADDIKKSAPAALLKSLFGRLSLDPFKFAGADDRDQMRFLLELIDFEYDKWKAERDSIFDKRTVVNNEVKRLEGAIKSTPNPTTDKTEEVSVRDALDALRIAQEWNENISKIDQAIETTAAEIEALQGRLRDLNARRSLYTDPVDLEAYKSSVENIEDVNRAIRDGNRWRELVEQKSTAKNRADELTRDLAKKDKEREAALDAAKLPVAGLSFDENGILFNDVPFSRASKAEKEKVSIALAIAAKPRAGVILVEDASLLDEDSMALVKSMAVQHKMQVWLEIVNSADEDSIKIVDGEVG